ncbi:MAG: hypothetical protein WDO19_15035 [Bacteroidota bacterium]
MYSNNNLTRVYVLLFVILNLNCKQKTHSQAKGDNNSILNCFIIKPVKNDSKADSLRDFDFSKDSIDGFLFDIISGKKSISYDSSMDYVTSFERQQLISINSKCFTKLSQPDSCNLMELYFSSDNRTKIMTKSIVEFLRSYKKTIYNFGNTTVFEYRFNGVAEVEPHFMYIILKEQTEEESRYGKDYKGIVVYSDGLDWKDYNDDGFSIPLFKQMVRRNKQFYIPLCFDGNRFVPIGHFKSSNW